MVRMSRPDVHLLSVGTALPGAAVDNAALARRFDLPPVWEQWIDMFVGIRSRHFSIDLDTGEQIYTLADLGETAGRRALTAAGRAAGDIDLMVMATSSPDMLMPATVNMVADRLGINDISTFQLQSGCTGAVQALDVASQLLTTGRHTTALVLGGDCCAKHFDVTLDVAALPPEVQVNALLFGDGLGAAVLSTEPAYGAPVLTSTSVRLVGLGRPPGQTVEWFSWADRGNERMPVLEDFKAVENSAPGMAAEALTDLLARVGWKGRDLDYILPPQLSVKMTERVLAGFDVPGAREVSCVREIANTGNGLVFFQLERLLEQMTTGERAAGVSVEASKWIKAGYALEVRE
jgi:3-oxoacyl-[acyl-carrier-protein] synthase-3